MADSKRRTLTPVVFGTDGNVDYLQTPDGVRYTLGSTSVLDVVLALVRGTRAQKETILSFNHTGSADALVDITDFHEMMTPVRRRWAHASHGPLITGQRMNPGSGRGSEPMTIAKQATLNANLDAVEKHIGLLLKTPKSAEGLKTLRSLVANLHFTDVGDQSKNDAWFGLGAPKVDTVDGTQPSLPADVTNPKTANLQALESVVQQVGQVNTKVTELTGKPGFAADKAMADTHKLASQAVELLNKDLSSPVATTAVADLAIKTAKLHGLFFPAK